MYIFIQTYIFIHKYLHTYIQTYMYYTHTHLCSLSPSNRCTALVLNHSSYSGLCIHTYVYIHTHIHIYTYIHTYILTYIQTYIYYIYTHLCSLSLSNPCTALVLSHSSYSGLCIHTYVYIHAHIHIYTYIHTYLHTNICILYIYIPLFLESVESMHSSSS
jgi:hypothetical protein